MAIYELLKAAKAKMADHIAEKYELQTAKEKDKDEKTETMGTDESLEQGAEKES